MKPFRFAWNGRILSKEDTYWILGTISLLLVIGLVFLIFAPKLDPEINEFMTWALGEDWKDVVDDMKDVPAHWNKRHGDLFELKGYDPIDEGHARMYKAWKEHNKLAEKKLPLSK